MVYFTIRHRPGRGHDRVLIYCGTTPAGLALAGELRLRHEEAHGFWRLLGGVHPEPKNLMDNAPFEDISIEVAQG